MRAGELVVGERYARGRGLQLRIGLRQLDFIGARIDHEQKVALVDNLAVGEMDFRQRAADLGAQFDAIDRGELPEEAEPGVDLLPQRPADRDGQHGRLRHGRLSFPLLVIGEAAITDEQEQGHRPARYPAPRRAPAGRDLVAVFFDG